jgi:lipopolysaccharide export system permease protein
VSLAGVRGNSPCANESQIPAMIGWTLGRYLSVRFLVMISAVFLLNSAMIYVVDLVELLRRSGNIPGVSAGYIAYLSLLRAPSLSEQILPFCVLFGAMATFLLLSRKLELLIARAVGVSVWGFLFPPVAIAALIGIVSVVAFTLALLMQQRAEQIEMRIFGLNGKWGEDTSLWIRQRSVDGEATTAFVYGLSGRFDHRIRAPTRRLLPGVWQFNYAQVTAPGEESFTATNYLLPTTLSAEEVARGTVAPDAVPFWDLPKVAAAAEAAGFDGTGYRIQYHTLLARPLLFIAMVLIAAAFSLRFFRFGGIEQMVLSGAGAGFVLYGTVKITGDLGGAGLLGPAIAAWSPAAVACLLGAFALLGQEDG